MKDRQFEIKFKLNDISKILDRGRKTNKKITINNIERTSSRSRCIIAKAMISEHNVSPYFTLLKLTPCEWSDHNVPSDVWGTKEDFDLAPAYSELQFFSLTNRFTELGIADAFVYSYNKQLLKSSVHEEVLTKKERNDFKKFLGNNVDKVEIPTSVFYTMLMTEYLDPNDTQTLRTYLSQWERRVASASPSELGEAMNDMKTILFQIIYTISCMTHINMAHMDLHFGNIFIRKKPHLIGKLKEYVFLNACVYQRAYVPAHVEVKIIDLDGAHKFEASGVHPAFKDPIHNKMWTGDEVGHTNPRANLLKVVHDFHFTRHQMTGTLNALFRVMSDLAVTTTRGHVPFFKSNTRQKIKDQFGTGHAFSHGIFLTKNNKLIDLTNDHILKPSSVLQRMMCDKGNFKRPTNLNPNDVIKTLSQKAIFNKQNVPNPKPKPARNVKGPKTQIPVPIKNIVKAQYTPIVNTAQYVKAHCPVKRGRPTKVCSQALKLLREACKARPNHVMVKRECREKIKPGPRLGYRRRVSDDIPFNMIKAEHVNKHKNSGVKNMRHRVQILCTPGRGRPTTACSETLREFRELCKQRTDHKFVKRDCILK